jgi:hypothetical protein
MAEKFPSTSYLTLFMDIAEKWLGSHPRIRTLVESCGLDSLRLKGEDRARKVEPGNLSLV